MNKSNLFTEAIYGFKSARRNILFRILVILAIVGIVICQFTPLSGGIKSLFSFSVDWLSQALPSSIAYKTAYFFNIVLLFLVVGFVANDLRIFKFSGMEPLHVRSLNNEEIVLGNFLGKLLLFTIVNFLVFAISILINFAFYPQSFDLSVYLFYWVTLNLPTLIFFLGISYLMTRLVRQQALSMLILFVALGILSYWGAGWLNGLFDPFARNIPNMFSNFTGHVGIENYLLQRGFILVVGLGCLVLSIIPYPRIPNCLYVFKRNFSVVCVVFLVAGSLAFVYVYRHGRTEDNRNVYKAVYEEYGNTPAARVVRNDLYAKDLGGGISVTSRMSVVNSSLETIPLVIYLNPGLKVVSFEIDEEAVAFKRESQAILPNRKLNPGEKVEISMRYEGGIENDICFMDTDREKYYSPAVNSFGIYRFGYAPAFCGKEYKLLTPECIWYPVCVPPYGATGVRDVNFTRYSLKVEHDSRLVAISQGNMIEERGGETIFTFHHDMPGISLCLGNYEKREIMVDSTCMTLYCLPGHDYLLGNYTDFPEKDLVDQLMYLKTNDFEMNGCIQTAKFKAKRFAESNVYDPVQQYPYRWFTLVEVPCNFYSFPGIMQLTGERVQGGMVFFPEKGFYMDGFFKERLKRSSNEEDVIGENMIPATLSNDVKPILDGGCDIMPQLLGKTAFIFSRECPIIHDVLGQVARARFYTIAEAFADGSYAAYPTMKYLSSHSLEEALIDKMLSPEILASIIKQKSKELYTRIRMEVGEKQFQQFYVDFLAKYLFKEVAVEEFFQQFYQTFGYPLDSLVRGWYTADRLPLFEMQDARVVKVKRTDDGMYGLYKFKVFNRGEVAGIVLSDEGQMWVIPPREGREICVRSEKNMVYATRGFYLDMPLAMNLPDRTELKIVEMKEEDVDTTTGVFSVDTSLFFTKGNEIIVDNEDPGFKIVKAKDNFITSLFRKEKSDEKYYKYFKGIDAWCPTIGERFYGFPIRSALYKIPGTGKQKVEWNIVLPQEGKYEVFFYYAELFEGGYGQNTAGKVRYYTVSDGENEYDVTITPSEHEQATWVSLGVFDFSKEAKVTLSDRTIDDGTPSAIGEGFVADAVKWVRVE